MIVEVDGDILLSKATAIAHSVAPNDDFHAGLALSLREEWPAMYKDFRHYCRLDHPAPGGVWAWKGPESPIFFSLFNQEGAYGHGGKPGKASLDHVNHSLGALRKECEKEGVKTLAMSRLATGVGGLDWQDVKPLIHKHFDATTIKIYLYSTYHKGVAAKET
jgi:O-acetyl-ADP-ribose deacetylase (regulator of RNase III)